MRRRNVLKSIGSASAAGASIGFGDIVKAAEPSRLLKKPVQIASFELGVAESDSDLPAIANCQSFSIHRHDERRNNFLLSKKGDHPADLEGADQILMTHTGSRSENTVAFDRTPLSSHVGGSATMVVGSPDQELKINRHNGNVFEFEFLSVSERLQPGKRVTKEVETTITYGRGGDKEAEVTLQVSAENHGKNKVIGSENYLFAKTKGARKALERRYKRNKRASDGKPEIREHDEVYEFVLPSGGDGE